MIILETMRALLLAFALLLPTQARETSAAESYASRNGIYPVYQMEKHWVLLDRYPGSFARRLKKNRYLLVVGSGGADFFTTARATNVRGAACADKRPAMTRGYLLKGKNLKRVGTPIIAYSLAKGAVVHPRRVRVSRLENQVTNDVYTTLGPAIREAEAREQNLQPDQIQVQIDFASAVALPGRKQGFLVVDQAQFSKTTRRCMRLFVDNKAAGRCAEMPRALLAETNLLEFVGYDLTGAGYPTVLAYTPKEPLWGHEHWGFQVTRKGVVRFLIDALDPKCRDKI